MLPQLELSLHHFSSFSVTICENFLASHLLLFVVLRWIGFLVFVSHARAAMAGS